MARKKAMRTFEGTRKKVPFVVETALTDAQAIKILRERSKTDDSFEAQCADQIEISGMKNVKVKVKHNLVAWGFRMAGESTTSHEAFTLPEAITSRVRCRRPLVFEVGEETVKITQNGDRSKYCGQFTITDGRDFRENRFYGRATNEGMWTPTRETPVEVVEAIRNFGE